MSRSAVTRKLAAILIADVVGFSRHMERDDAGTFARLREIRERIVDPKIAEYGGRVVKTAGDGMLLEFSSADAALHCAIDVQRAMQADNQSKPSGERIEFRIGINIGDIIVDGTDIAGDGVNVASRLEALAEPGGICVSSAVREQVHGSLDVGFTDIGEQQVKNIMRPLRVYQVMLGGAGAQATAADRSLRARVSPHRRWWVVGAVLGLASIVSAWLLLPLIKSSPVPADSPPPMSISILPFVAASDSPADRQYAEQLTRDLTTSLGRDRWVTVAALSLASAFTGKTIDLPSVGRQLNVRYVAEGEIRHVGEKLTIAMRMTDAKTRQQVWSDRLEYENTALAANPDAAELQLTKRIDIALYNAEVQRARSDPAPRGAMDLVLRGRAEWRAQESQPGLEGIYEGRRRYEAALRLDPNFVPALSSTALTYEAELENSPTPDHTSIEGKMDVLTARAVSIDPSDDRAWVTRAWALDHQGRWDEALAAVERAETLNPWRPDNPISRAWFMISMGRPADALAAAQRAAAIDPPGSWLTHLLTCESYFYLGRYDNAVAVCQKSAGLNNWWVPQMYLAAAYAQVGDMSKATIARDALLKAKPGFTTDLYRKLYYSGTPTFFDLLEKHLATGLRKVDVPEK